MCAAIWIYSELRDTQSEAVTLTKILEYDSSLIKEMILVIDNSYHNILHYDYMIQLNKFLLKYV